MSMLSYLWGKGADGNGGGSGGREVDEMDGVHSLASFHR